MLKFTPSPTFKLPVTIHVPGESDERITVEFRHKTRDQLKTLLDDMREGKATDEQVLGDVVAGWSDVDEKFTKDALKQLCQNYASAAGSFIDAYIQGITKGRAGN